MCFVQQALCCFCGSMMCILPDFEHHALFGEYVCLNVASNITCAASKIQRSYIIFDIINTKWPWFIYYHAYQNSKHHPGEIAKPLPSPSPDLNIPIAQALSGTTNKLLDPFAPCQRPTEPHPCIEHWLRARRFCVLCRGALWSLVMEDLCRGGMGQRRKAPRSSIGKVPSGRSLATGSWLLPLGWRTPPLLHGLCRSKQEVSATVLWRCLANHVRHGKHVWSGRLPST